VELQVLLYYCLALLGCLLLNLEVQNPILGVARMKRIVKLVVKWQIWRDCRAQDLIEYALMAGFVAVAAGAIMPGVASSINVIFSEVNSIMVSAASS
jgi:Flp pilus assembly pilin Flp